MTSRSAGEPLERRLFQLALAAAVLALLAIGYPLIGGQVYVDTDLGNAHLPVRHFYSASLAVGDDFDWFPYQFNGHYLHGEGQFGLRHPLNWLSYRLLPLQVAFNLELLRSYALLLIGSYCLARRWRLRRDASMLAAILFTFGSFNTLHFMHVNMVFGIAHLPFLLLAVDVLLRSPSPRRAAWAAVGVSLLTASQILIGFPQSIWLSLVATGLYALTLLLAGGRPARLAALCAAWAIAAPIGAVQLLPQLDALALSERAVRGPQFAFEHSLHPINLAQLVSPLLFVERGLGNEAEGLEFAVYAGAAFPLLLTWLWIRRSSKDGPSRLAVGLLLLGCGLFVLLALGHWGGIYRLQMVLPVVERLRVPARYIVLFQLAASALAALAYVDLARWVERGRALPWRRLTPLLTPIGLAFAMAVGAMAIRALRVDSALATGISEPLRLAAGPILLALAGGCVAACALGQRAALVALLILAVADPIVYGVSFIWRTPPAEVDRYPAQWKVPLAARDHRLHWGPPALVMRQVRLASGYAALVPRRQLPTDQYGHPARPSPALLASLRVSDIGHAHGRPVPEPLARARLLTRARVTRDLLRQMASIDVDTTALVAREVDLEDEAARPGRARIVGERPGLIVIETEARSRQLLVLAESHHPGWRARVDDGPAEIERVYGDFMGVVVPAGRHDVRLSFEPDSLRRGRQISLLGLALLVPLYWGIARGRTGTDPDEERSAPS